MHTVKTNTSKHFYDKTYADGSYGAAKQKINKIHYREANSFINEFQLSNKRCLEVGCGIGLLQDSAIDYVGIDITESVGKHLHKPFVVCDGAELPFPNNNFDAIWSITTLEHVPNPEKALSEMRRVLKNGGLLYLHPAWFCKPWAAQGYPVRPYSDFSLSGKIIKASILARNSKVGRYIPIFWHRLMRLAVWLNNHPNLRLKFRELHPNYEKFWMPDSDAINSIDPFEVILWFLSRGDECISQPDHVSQFFVNSKSIILRINKV